MTREGEGAGGAVQLRALDFVELGQLSLNFLVRIQSGGRPRRPFCSSLALISHNQGVGEYMMAWDNDT